MNVIALVLEVVLWAIGCVLLADFVSGLFHWLEDSYGSARWKITGKWVTEANDLHHREPRAFIKNSWLQSADVLLILGALILGVAALLGCLSWQLGLIVFLGVNSNEIHKWAHRSPRENGKFIAWMQRAKIVQSTAHHAKHHRGTKDSHYCVITAFLNPVLEKANFWRRLEKVVFFFTRIPKRLDPTVKIPVLPN